MIRSLGCLTRSDDEHRDDRKDRSPMFGQEFKHASQDTTAAPRGEV